MKATWKDAVLAESDDTVVVEGNHYFPRESIRPEHLRASATHTTCHWKGQASYWSVTDDLRRGADVAWSYLDAFPAADEICGHVAFWRGVRVVAG